MSFDLELPEIRRYDYKNGKVIFRWDTMLGIGV